jgi:uncharacterized protein involved in tolerance to divalent cations
MFCPGITTPQVGEHDEQLLLIKTAAHRKKVDMLVSSCAS